MFDHRFSASHQGRDASILSSISEAISGERSPRRHHEGVHREDQTDIVQKLRRENDELKAKVATLSRVFEGVRETLSRRPAPIEENVVEFEPIAVAVEIGRRVRSARSSQTGATTALRSFERRKRNAFLELRTRYGSEEAIDLSTLRKVGGLNANDGHSATIIVFPIGRTGAGKASFRVASVESEVGSTVSDGASPVGLDVDTSATSGPETIEQEFVAAGPTPEDLISAVHSCQPSLTEEGPTALFSERNHSLEALADETASCSEVNDSAESDKDDEVIVAAREPDRCHRDWSRAQRLHFMAYACVGHSAMTIAKLMTQAYGERVSVGTVRLALADRALKLSRTKPRKKPSKAKPRTL